MSSHLGVSGDRLSSVEKERYVNVRLNGNVKRTKTERERERVTRVESKDACERMRVCI
jgi:hypothetical protein